MRKQISVYLNTLVSASTLTYFLNTLANLNQMWHKRAASNATPKLSLWMLLAGHSKPPSLTIHTALALEHIQRSDHKNTPFEMPEEIWGLLIAFCFLQYTFPTSLYTSAPESIPSQSRPHPPTPIPYSRATPLVSDSRRHYTSLRDRDADYTAAPEAWHERFPTWQHWGIHAHLHLCTTAGSKETLRWTSTTKSLHLSLHLWHKQCSFSPVLQPNAKPGLHSQVNQIALLPWR